MKYIACTLIGCLGFGYPAEGHKKGQYKIELILIDLQTEDSLKVGDYEVFSNKFRRFKLNDEYFGHVDIKANIRTNRIGRKSTFKIESMCNNNLVHDTVFSIKPDAYVIQYPLNYKSYHLQMSITPLERDQNPEKNITGLPAFKIAQWASIIARKHHIDTTKTVHAGGDPYVMAFCNNAKTNKHKAAIYQADLLIRQDKTYFIVHSAKIKQVTNEPVLWKHAWNDCTLTVYDGTISRYDDSSKLPVEEWNGNKMQIVIKNNMVESIFSDQ